MLDMELLGMIGYSGYLAVIAGIAYDKLRTKSADGIQIEDVTTSVIEAKQVFDEFLDVITTVIDDSNVNDADTIAFIQNAVKVAKGK